MKSVASQTQAAFALLLEQRSSFFSAQKNAPKADTPKQESRKLTRAQKTRLLIDAAEAGDIQAAEDALALGASINSVGARDTTPLGAAFDAGQEAMLRFLLDRGAKPTEKTWRYCHWSDRPETAKNRYLCAKILSEHGFRAPKDLATTLLGFNSNGNATLLALAETGEISLSGEQGAAMAFHMIERGLPSDMAEQAKKFITPGPWQQRLSFSESHRYSSGTADTLLHSALSSDRVDLLLFLFDCGYLEGVATAQWKCSMGPGSALSLVSRAVHLGAGRITQTLARVPAFSEQFSSVSEEEAEHMLSGRHNHEAWRGFWEGGGNPLLKNKAGDTLLHRLADISGGAPLPFAEDLIRRAPGIEDLKNKKGQTVWDVAKEHETSGRNYRVERHAAFVERLRVSIDQIRIRKQIGPHSAKRSKKTARTRRSL